MAGDDDVVLVVPGLFVEVPSAGDESDLRVLRIAIDLVVGERVLAVVGDVIDAQGGLRTILAGDGERLFAVQGTEVEERRRSFTSFARSDVSDHERGPDLTGCGRAGRTSLPVASLTQRRDFELIVVRETKLHDARVDVDGRNVNWVGAEASIALSGAVSSATSLGVLGSVSAGEWV